MKITSRIGVVEVTEADWDAIQQLQSHSATLHYVVTQGGKGALGTWKKKYDQLRKQIKCMSNTQLRVVWSKLVFTPDSGELSA